MIRTAVINTTTGLVELVLMCDAVPDGSAFGPNYITRASDTVNVGWSWDGTSLKPPAAPAVAVPATITPRQARLALLGAGLLDQANSAVNAAGGATLITWEYASVIDRNDPLIAALGGTLGLSASQIDALFVTAAAL